MIRAFFERTGLPLVLNTSLNGPGQPIIEHPKDAILFLLDTPIDALYMDGYKITRIGQSKAA